VIELADVRKAFNQGRPNELWAVRGVSLTIEASRATVLQGPSGSGKTTLLTLVGCLARPTAGRVRVSGREVSGMTERFLTELRRRTFGFVFQQFHLVRGLSALENVMLPAYPLGDRRDELARRAGGLLRSLGVDHRAAERAELLSGGEAQRIAVARALVNDPEVIVADEPTAHLDTRASAELLEILGGLRDRGKAVLVASHDPLVYESPLADRVIAIRDGRIAGEGT
jgi:putative ABC transport system ATP-binding protein